MVERGNARIYEVIDFYRGFHQYSFNTESEIYFHIYPSFTHGQYRIYRDGNQIIGFCNWCFLDDLAQAKFIKSGILYPNQWKSGENFWIHDLVASKNTVRIAKDVKKMVLTMIGNRKDMNYLRIKNNKVFGRRKFRTKNHWGR